MILSRKWLNEFVDCSAWADHDFSEAMTLSGSKVETFTDLHKNIQNVVAGRIVEMVRHTNSDHMWVCQVDVGGSEPLQIVTGAQNQKVGDMVPVALDGSLLPDGKEIHAGMLRGELSNGMMCSLKELGLTLHDYPYAIEDGLWIMQEDGVKVNKGAKSLSILEPVEYTKNDGSTGIAYNSRRYSMWHRPAARSLLHLPLTVIPESSLLLCSTRLPLM